MADSKKHRFRTYPVSTCHFDEAAAWLNAIDGSLLDALNALANLAADYDSLMGDLHATALDFRAHEAKAEAMAEALEAYDNAEDAAGRHNALRKMESALTAYRESDNG